MAVDSQGRSSSGSSPSGGSDHSDHYGPRSQGSASSGSSNDALGQYAHLDTPYIPPPTPQAAPPLVQFNAEHYPAYDTNARRIGMEHVRHQTFPHSPGGASYYLPRTHMYPGSTGGFGATANSANPANIPQAGRITRSEHPGIPLAPDPTPLVDFQTRSLSDTPDYVEVPLPSFPSPRAADSSVASPSPGDSNEIPDLERELRRRFALSDDTPINLNVIPDPPPGEKPGQSYPTLIKLAIYGSPHKRLTLQGIFEALENRFEWFRNNRHDRAWQVRISRGSRPCESY